MRGCYSLPSVAVEASLAVGTARRLRVCVRACEGRRVWPVAHLIELLVALGVPDLDMPVERCSEEEGILHPERHQMIRMRCVEGALQRAALEAPFGNRATAISCHQ